MKEGVRKLLHPIVPTHFNDPVSLTLRVLGSRDAAAYSALFNAAGQALMTPLDMALSPLENRLYRRAEPPTLPIILVAGAPRSGTTLFTQTLISSLPLAYLNNLSAMFPRAPVLVNNCVPRPFRNEQIECKNYYGKSRNWYGPNDSLYLWDRWLGSDRTLVPSELQAGVPQQIQQFFGAFEAAFQRPLVAKNNALNTFAHLIAQVLPTAVFLCIRRDPLYLAQSLLIARRHIHGSDSVPYGLDDPQRRGQQEVDIFESVCRQVAYHRRQEALQVERVGADRFLIVGYEEFCRDPGAVVRRIADRTFDHQAWNDERWEALRPLHPSVSRKLSAQEFDRLKQALDRQGIPLHT